jgi:S-DNA-T family DNA segregation ATPase FtsK/SpoIIIE
VYLAAGIALLLSLVSYSPQDPSWNTQTMRGVKPHNLLAPAGSYLADFCLQLMGLGSFVIPVLVFVLGWKWLRSQAIESQPVKVAGAAALLLFSCTALAIVPVGRIYGGAVLPGGIMGLLMADFLIARMSLTGAVLVTATALIVSLYIVTTFELAVIVPWLERPMEWIAQMARRWMAWRAERRKLRAQKKLERKRLKAEAAKRARAEKLERARQAAAAEAPVPAGPPAADMIDYSDTPPIETEEQEEEAAVMPANSAPDDIPIRTLEDLPPWDGQPAPVKPLQPRPEPKHQRVPTSFRLPSTALLAEPPARNSFDGQELKETAAAIKSKFEEFNVLGSVVQINPGPVVTTFEFKPEAGIKYSRITTLTEDLCLGLQAESILIERIPGKPTVGIEVPNSKMEVISLRQIIESDEFQNSPSRLTMCLGKDINGRIKVASLESMPHLLIAGSTGSGKSVMLNSMIMSMLYKSTPDEVRMIMVDPKRVELGIYEGIPHLLTPVITDPKKATNALRNAVLEMERRLKLLASHGVRNIDQFNRKVRQMANVPRNLFAEEEQEPAEELRPLPFIMVLIDELADLMMLERAGVEESVTRLAQMARAVGIHLVLATQRPSVDVITGLIKANFPARISFRVATRVDSRTILDVMGAEHLLGRGDMMFLPPGSSRLTRVHGAYVSEAEINKVVDYWKDQAKPEYDQSFLLAPPSEDGDAEGEEYDGEQDPMYEDAVRVVLDMGKASTSTLQRRLRLGYGRAARILDMMQREGIIGPPDGSKPREVLKRPDWLREIEDQLR